MWKKMALDLVYYPGICLEGLRKTTKKLKSLGGNLNQGPPEYEARMLPTQL
jgi:hypothetical protein